MRFQDTIQEMGFDFALEVFKASFDIDEKQGLTYAFEAGLADRIKNELA
jgi:hypothetical protein